MVIRQFSHPDMSRFVLDRLLRRHGVSNLEALIAAREGDESPSKAKKGFKDYEPGFVYIGVKYLPKISDEAQGRCLFVAVDQVTRWVYLEIHAAKEAKAAAGFLKRLVDKAPFKNTLGHVSPVRALYN